jgi:UDP:flavonoid glycosyltransferase YjiC (YdhE family)
MRILVITQPEQSYLWPMVPYLRAVEAAGHEVRVGTGDHFLKHIERAGLSGVACGLDWSSGHAHEEQLRAMAIEDGQQRNAFVQSFAGPADGRGRA